MALILLLFVGNKAFLSGTILQGHSKSSCMYIKDS